MKNTKSRHINSLFGVVSIMLLVGCSAPPVRENISDFTKAAEGHIPSHAIYQFTDCILEGFNRLALGTNMAQRTLVKEQTFSSFRRVESISGSVILGSADIHKDGRVELYTANTIFSKEPERNVFETCLRISPKD